MKLGLGTVQFGLPYGINNTTGKPDFQKVNEIIQYAHKHDITLFDTASDYGDSEEVIGKCLTNASVPSTLVTKVSRTSAHADESVRKSLDRLGVKKVYGLLIHHFDQYTATPSLWHEMTLLKEAGIVDKIGFSLYLPEQLESLLKDNVPLDILQLPYNVLDQRFEPYFKTLKKNNVEIHIRSVFMQGLVFKKTKDLNSFFLPIKPKLDALAALSTASGKSIQSLCLNFVNSHRLIDKMIIGVDSVENLASNIDAMKIKTEEKEIQILRSLQETDEKMILPYNWVTT